MIIGLLVFTISVYNDLEKKGTEKKKRLLGRFLSNSSRADGSGKSVFVVFVLFIVFCY